MPMPNDNLYWYVLFVRTGCEEKLVAALKASFDKSVAIPFTPTKTGVFRRAGKKSLFQKICFPGYIFIESTLPPLALAKYSFVILNRQKDIYRFLSYEGRFDTAMRESEREALSKLLGKERSIDISMGLREGDCVKIISGPLLGLESRIVKIDKNRQNAVIIINMFGDELEMSVGLSIIEKTCSKIHFS